jgi:hypothetical protein
MKRFLPIVLVVCGTAATAAADAAKDAKALVTKQVKLIKGSGNGTDTEGLVATFHPDAVAMLPNGPYAHAELALGLEEALGVGDVAVTSAKLKNLKVGAIGAGAAWVTADIVVKYEGGNPDTGETMTFGPETFRVTELVVDDGQGAKVRAAHWSLAKSDKEAKAEAKEAGYMQHEKVPGAFENADYAALLSSMTALSALVGKDKAATVIGSGKNQKAVGGAKAKKLLKKWSKIPFAVVGGVRWIEGAGYAYAMAHVDAQLSKKDTVRYRVLAIFRADGTKTELVSIHYSSPR